MLWARALYVEDEETGERVVVCVLDLLSASLRLLYEVHDVLGPASPLDRRIILCGTHTHTAPGRFFGNRFYDTLAQRGFRGYSSRLARGFARATAEACQEAADSAVAGALSVHSRLLWGPGGNRSLEAHRAGRRDREAPPDIASPPPGVDPYRSAVDPRLLVMCAHTDERLLGVFGWYGCHATALGRKHERFDRDWPGVAVNLVEAELGCLCAVGVGAAGDVSPLPSSVYELPAERRADQARVVAAHQGPGLASDVGGQVGRALVDVARGSSAVTDAVLPVTFSAGLFEVAARGTIPRWQIGVPALGGAEDGGPSVPLYDFFYQFVSEGFANNTGPQRPKAAALGFLQEQSLGLLDLSPFHPWYRLRLGEHAICTVPGEPTVTAARVLEGSAMSDLCAASASIIGCAGDYAGYFTTPAEYGLQHYEGASTLYGPKSLEWYRDQLMGPGKRLPALGAPVPLRDGAVPQRHLARLAERAHELKPTRDGVATVLFAVQAGATPTDVALQSGAAVVPGYLRRFPNPDPDAPRRYDTFTASFELQAPGLAAPVEVDGGELSYQLNGIAQRQSVVPYADAERNGRLPRSMNQARLRLDWIRRTFLGLTLLFGTLGLTTFAPWLVLSWLGWPAEPFDVLMTSELGLSFGLLAINFGYAKNSRDLTALTGYACAGATLALVVALAFAFGGAPHLATAMAGVGVLLLIWLALRIHGATGGQRVPAPHYWEFWRPLFWVSGLTLVSGALIVLLPELVAASFGIENPRSTFWLRVFAGGFLVNTVSMWRCRYTRDLRVVRGQLLGSIYFDSSTLVLFSISVAFGIFNPWGLVLLVPFALIVVTFPRIAHRARRREKLDLRRPRTTRELRRLVTDARLHRLVLRVIGSGHSVPGAIFDREPGPRASRPSSAPEVYVSLEYFDQVLDVDREAQTITVQAGMHMGEDPKEPSSVNNNLLLHLRDLGWAVGDLGGIVHQTIGGFLATGASGGSLRYALFDNVISMRYVDGHGDVKQVERGTPEFDAFAVSMGLLGVLIEVTFRCVSRYQVRGREFAVDVVDGAVELPAGGYAGANSARRRVELRSSGAQGLAAYLGSVDFCRILWWPQENVSKMVIWEAFATDEIPLSERPYKPDAGLAQWVAGLALRLLGWSYGGGIRRVWGRVIRRRFLPWIVDKYLPSPAKRFHAGWDVNLPMDTHVDDALLPVEFTELWFPLENTGQVMEVLLDMYRDPDTAGTFTVELYIAGHTEAWLSPAYRRDCFRVDIFWFQKNAGDPVLEYFPRFYERLAALQFRPHWGKYLPQPGSAQGVEYLRRAYERWDEFMAARAAADPDGVFLSQYWRRHLGL